LSEKNSELKTNAPSKNSLVFSDSDDENDESGTKQTVKILKNTISTNELFPPLDLSKVETKVIQTQSVLSSNNKSTPQQQEQVQTPISGMKKPTEKKQQSMIMKYQLNRLLNLLNL